MSKRWRFFLDKNMCIVFDILKCMYFFVWIYEELIAIHRIVRVMILVSVVVSFMV